jgi:tRNA A-37 threonylcarbamoyl transferase component Bud32/tetratricopeptide (TPR) repeat protein
LNAQGEALLGLARRRGLLAESVLKRARALDGDAARIVRGLQQLGVETDALRKLMKVAARTQFRCARCRVAVTFEGLAELEALVCSRCASPLEASESRAAKKPAPGGGDESTQPPLRETRSSAGKKRSGTAPKITTSRGRIEGARTIGPFETIKVLGKGANGTVWLARKPGLDRLFALKVLAGNALADDISVERFRREAQVASRLEQHPGIVSVVDVGETEGVHFYAMDYCPGPTLQAVLADQAPMAPQAAAEVVSDLARAIGFAHSHDVVHRDLKPANVIVDERTAKPRITDFGLAHDRRDQRVTRTGDVLGTPYYMAPEQFRGEKDVDARADIYALGVILYEALTGKRPFEAETAALLASVVLTEELRPPSEVDAGVPRELDAIVMKAMAKEREQRYARAELFADDLDRFRAGVAPKGASPETTVQRTLRKGRRHVGWRTFLGIGVGLALLGGAAAVVALSTLGGARSERGRAALDDARRRTRQGAGIAEIEPLIVLARTSLGSTPEIELAWAGALAKRGRGADACAVASAIAASSPAFLASATLLQAEVAGRRDRAAAAQLLEPIAASVPVARARQLFFSGDMAGAAAKAREALAANPDDSLAEATLALALAREGDVEKARVVAVRALERAPGDPDALVARAYVELREPGALTPARVEATEEWLARAVDLEKAEPDGLVFFARAWIRLSRADLEGARDELRAAEARRHDPESGALLASLDATLTGASTTSRLLTLSTTARDRFFTLASRASVLARGHLLIALVTAGEGLPADPAFDAARTAAPRDPVVALARLRWLVGRDRYEEAVPAREAARDAGCDLAELDRLEGDRRWRMGDVAEATRIFRDLAHRDTGASGQYARAAFWLLHEDRTTATRQRVQAMVANAPDSPELHRIRAYGLIIPEVSIATEGVMATGVAEAEKALELEGALDLESFFLQQYGAVVPETVAAPVKTTDAFEGIRDRFLPLVPTTGRYCYYLGRATLKWGKEVPRFLTLTLECFAEAGRREPRRALQDLGLAFLEMVKGAKNNPKGSKTTWHVEGERQWSLARAHLVRARELEPLIWIPKEWMDHVEENEPELWKQLKLDPLPKLE